LDDGASPDTAQKFEEIWFVEQMISKNKNAIKFKLSPALGLTNKLSSKVMPKQSLNTFTTS
jgi:phage-related protein